MGRKTLHVRNICDQVAQREGFGAHKVIEYDYGTHMATVYYLGDHRCSLQVDHAKCSQILKKCLEDRNPTGSAKEVGLREVGLLIESGEMDMAAAEAEKTGWITELPKGKWRSSCQLLDMTTTPLMQLG